MNPWDERYSISEFYYGTEPNDFLKDHASNIKKGGKVLCMAEGEGRNAVYLAKLGLDVTAVDQSSVGLNKLNELASKNGVSVHTVVADLADYAITPESWDAVISIWCHVPPSLRRKLHASVVAGLKPGGILILEAYEPRQLEFKTGGPPVAELMMKISDLKNEFSGLEMWIAHEIERDVQEGKGHFGMSAVTQLLALKR